MLEAMLVDYLHEREQATIIQEEGGFAIVYLINEEIPEKKSILVKDIYVKPELRGTGVFKKLHDRIDEMGRVNKCKMKLGHIVINMKGSTESLRAHLNSDGIKLSHCEGNLIWLYKEL